MTTKRERRELRRAGLLPPRRSEHLSCSFCGKAKKDVRKLIGGPGVSICNECVVLCVEILDELEHPAAQ